tara:strand:- start:3228 stop:3371 length:144 start_codon:yes stop_codon:yes gene_type:complete
MDGNMVEPLALLTFLCVAPSLHLRGERAVEGITDRVLRVSQEERVVQ